MGFGEQTDLPQGVFLALLLMLFQVFRMDKVLWALVGTSLALVRGSFGTWPEHGRDCFACCSAVVRLLVEADSNLSRSPVEAQPKLSRSGPEPFPKQSRSVAE
ncbi:MAG TPA: hypothetical protein DHU90_12515 [Sphingobacterium sp.]|nr:hypothetical protein [Sphingobacterium sp.]HCX57380.1 hypothetical protein [Sphingobacterium sp.]